MTMTQLREKIKELNAELDNTGESDRHPSHTAVELIEAQAELIQKLQLAIIKYA